MGMKGIMAAGAIAGILAMGAPAASAAPIDLDALGLQPGPTLVAATPTEADFFGGFFSLFPDLTADTLVFIDGDIPATGPVSLVPAIALTGPGLDDVLDGDLALLGFEADTLEFLFDVLDADGIFAGPDQVLATVTGDFGNDPFGLNTGVPTLTGSVSGASVSVIAVAPLNPVPTPAAYWLLLTGLASLGLATSRR